MRRRAVLAVVITMVSAIFAGCSGSAGEPVARLSVDGLAEVSRQDENASNVEGNRSLRVGDRVLVREGTAMVRLGGDRQLELRKGSSIELVAGPGESSVRTELLGGSVLATAGNQPVTVTSDGSELLVTGTARVSRTLSLLVATYRGSTEITSGGRTMSVPAFRQVNVAAAGLLPNRPSPVEYVASDAWDQRLLSDAVNLGAQLGAKSRGFSSQPGAGDGRTPGYFRQLLPALAAQPEFDTLLDASRPAGETLVGAAIVLESRRGTFADRWSGVFGFRGDGADWGFVAGDQGVDGSAVLNAVDAAIGRAPAPLFAGGTVPPTTRPPQQRPPPPRTTPTTAPPRAPATATTVAPPALPPVPPGGLNTGLPIVDETVTSLVDTLGGLLRGLGGE